MSDQTEGHEVSPTTMDAISGVVISSDSTTPRQDKCLKAKVLRAAFDISPSKIPEDFEAANLDGYKCPFVSRDGKECTFADPMVFLKHKVGFVAMGSKNFCRSELDSPRDFKRVALGSIGVKAVRFVRDLNAALRHRFGEESN